MSHDDLCGLPRADLACLVDRLAGRRILVYGDLVADEFVHTEAPRVSREAPVLILRYRESHVVPGAAANAASNMAALGGVPVLVGELGDDEQGRDVLDALERAGADVGGVVRHEGAVTPRKSRFLSGDRHVASQQVVRVDRIDTPVRDDAFHREVKARLVRLLDDVDGILVSDYGIGFVEPETVQALVLGAPAREGRKVALDSRHRLFQYRGIDVATPSEPELEVASARSLTRDRDREDVARTALDRLAAEALVLTRGSLGMEVHRDGEETVAIPAFGTETVTDVTGAGDTVIATLSLALAAGATYLEAAVLANVAAGIVVTKPGTATVSARELKDALA